MTRLDVEGIVIKDGWVRSTDWTFEKDNNRFQLCIGIPYNDQVAHIVIFDNSNSRPAINGVITKEKKLRDTLEEINERIAKKESNDKD